MFNLGSSQLTSGKYGDAVYSFTAAIVKGMDTADVHAKRGWAYYQLSNYKGALIDFDRAIAGDANRAGYFNERGLTHHALENYRPASTMRRRKDSTSAATRKSWTNASKPCPLNKKAGPETRFQFIWR